MKSAKFCDGETVTFRNSCGVLSQEGLLSYHFPPLERKFQLLDPPFPFREVLWQYWHLA